MSNVISEVISDQGQIKRFISQLVAPWESRAGQMRLMEVKFLSEGRQPQVRRFPMHCCDRVVDHIVEQNSTGMNADDCINPVNFKAETAANKAATDNDILGAHFFCRL